MRQIRLDKLKWTDQEHKKESNKAKIWTKIV